MDRIKKFQLLLEESVGVPFTQGNRIKIYQNGDEIFPAMLRAIENSTRSIEFLTYVFWSGHIGGKFADALSRKASQGVNVYVLVDAIGGKRISVEHMHELRSAGVKFEKFRPVFSKYLTSFNHRTHRKVLVCDRKIGFTGGVGIADYWEGSARNENEWRETQFSIEGPAVSGLRAGFIGNWIETENGIQNFLKGISRQEKVGNTPIQVIKTGSSIKWNDIATILETLFCYAEEEINITTPYLVMGKKMLGLLCDAAQRGVKVRIIIPIAHNDYKTVGYVAKTTFFQLIHSGVEIYEYLPTFIHSKIMTVDSVLSIVGSANFNSRSMRRDEELLLSVPERRLAKELNCQFEKDLLQCRRITLKSLKARPLKEKVIGHTAKIFKSHM